jgi:uncharacterized protein (TIGR02265 family)
MAERVIKGSVLKSRLAFIEQKLGTAGVTRVVSRLRPSDRDILQGILLPAAWYPFETAERLDQVIVDELGGRDEIYKELGAKSAELNLSASQKVYVRERDPHGLLKAAASIYRLYYATGERTYERTADKKATLRTTGSDTYSRHDCLTILGWHEQAIAMCGGQHPRVRETKCRARGDDCCEYICEWE